MSVKSKPGVEKELAQWMWMQGWWPVRTASQTVNGAPEADMVFMKDGHVLAVKLIHLKAGSSKKRVVDKSKELRDIRGRASSYSFKDDGTVMTGFVIKKGLDDEWYWKDDSTNKILYKSDDDKLREVLPV